MFHSLFRVTYQMKEKKKTLLPCFFAITPGSFLRNKTGQAGSSQNPRLLQQLGLHNGAARDDRDKYIFRTTSGLHNIRPKLRLLEEISVCAIIPSSNTYPSSLDRWTKKLHFLLYMDLVAHAISRSS